MIYSHSRLLTVRVQLRLWLPWRPEQRCWYCYYREKDNNGPVVTAHLKRLVPKERHDNGRHTVLEPDCCRPRSAVMADRRNAAVGKQPIVRYIPYKWRAQPRSSLFTPKDLGLPRMNTFSGTFSPPMSLHPALTRALTPVLSTASKIVAVSFAGSSTTIEPKLLTSRGSEVSRWAYCC